MEGVTWDPGNQMCFGLKWIIMWGRAVCSVTCLSTYIMCCVFIVSALCYLWEGGYSVLYSAAINTQTCFNKGG